MPTKLIITYLFALVFCWSDALSQADSLSQNIKIGKVKKLYYQVGFGLTTVEKESGKNDYNPSFYGTVGYRVHTLFQPGIAIGYDEYNEFSGFPIQLYIQGDLLSNKKTPFYYVQAGYTHFFDDDNDRFDSIEEGKVFEIGLGYSWAFDKVSLRLSGGWRRQLATTKGWGFGAFLTDSFAASSFWPASYQTTEWSMDRLVFKFGLVF